MSTVTDELFNEGLSLLGTKNAEEIHKLGDRIISAEPDNWFGSFIRGCGYAVESDFGNCIVQWEKFLKDLEDDSAVEKLCPAMCDCLAYCLNHVSGKPNLDFSKLGEMLNTINDKLPESDDEVFVTRTLAIAMDSIKAGSPVEPVLTYYSYKALVFSSFRAYVELPILSGFISTLLTIGEELKIYGNTKFGEMVTADALFLNELKAAMDTAVSSCPPETLEQIEEYWLEHNINPYMTPLQQAYGASAAAATGGKLTGKIAKKMMLTQVQLFIKSYLGAKI